MSPSPTPSRSRSRMSSSRHALGGSVSYAQSILPDGPVDEETVELLDELMHPHHEQDDTLVDDAVDHSERAQRSAERQQLPWWKRPSPWWLLLATPISTIAMSATMAPKIEVYTLLACSVHKPEIFKDTQLFSAHLPPSLRPHDDGPNTGASVRPSFDVALSNTSTMNAMTDQKPSPCASDPVVQAAVAKLTTAITTSMGVLGCLTTAWWGSFSDRYGRTRILGLTIAGLLINDFNFILVAQNFRRIPGGYWFLIVGPIIEGCLGGFVSASAASHAYMADTTTSSERSRIFSLFLGLVFFGLGFGPTIGSLLIRFTQNLLSVFYLAAGVHLSYAIMAWFLLPESLTKAQMHSAHLQHQESRRLRSEEEVTLLVRFQRLFDFLKPLTIFFPEPVNTAPKGRKCDWNLTLLAIAYAFTVSIMGSMMVKFQYLITTYEWNSELVGYFLTITGATRAICLAVFIPVAIKFAKGDFKRSRVPESEPLVSDGSHRHSASFDLALARGSIVLETIAYATMPFAPTGLSFTLLTMLASMGSGFTPALQSAALELYGQKVGGGANVESGKLFGALSVLQALCGQILGPAIYGLVYIKTLATFPQAIFMVSLTSVIISSICLSLVRLPTDVRTDVEEVSHIPDHGVRDATLVDVDLPGETDGALRGRKKVPPAVPEVTVSAPTP
ncbi:major facilitator superfamily domain-containing protein [Mycena belliarum]|uniref:Major facilitator superfamily domain-containing protein n=1 Tax=Mycena belliarum TaxID=1033014 RepID=A0AAD6UC42_9AGAR|nr:major facilitator superfamily domain-containing protein [Mycena belliae]